MLLFAALCGLVQSRHLAGSTDESSNWTAIQSFAFSRWLARANRPLSTCLATLLLLTVAFGGVETSRAASLEQASAELRQERELFAGTERSARPQQAQLLISDVSREVNELQQALRALPDDAVGHLQLAEHWIFRARLTMWGELRSRSPATVSDESLWKSTVPLALQGTVYRLEADRQRFDLDNLRRSDSAQIDLKNAARQLVLAIQANPLLPRPHLLLAELSPLIGAAAGFENHLANASRLAGGEHQLFRETGLAYLQAGLTQPEHVEAGLANLRRAVELAPEQLGECLHLASSLTDPQLVVTAISPDSPRVLLDLCRTRFSNDESSVLRYAVLQRTSELIRSGISDPAEQLQLEGAVLALQQQDERAIKQMTDAVTQRPDMVVWRYELATVLKRHGDIDLAWKHARTCVRMEPTNERFNALLTELTRARSQR